MKKYGLSLVLVSVILTSCSIQKRHYFRGFYVQKHNSTTKTKQAPDSRPTYYTEEPMVVAASTAGSNRDGDYILTKEYLTVENRVDNFVIEDCDIIILKNGDEIKGKVTEITLTEVKYKKCENQSGPTISISKKEVFMIRYPNGTKDIINTIPVKEPKTEISHQDSPSGAKKMNGLAVAAFVLALFSSIGAVYFGIGIATGILSVVFASIALYSINRNKEAYRGKGLAIAALILGLLMSLGWAALFYATL